MLVEFSVGNFWSFKDIQTLHLQAAKISSRYPELDKDNVALVDRQLSVLKTKAIFGANGSGKSNLVRAISAMLHIVQDGLQDMEVLKKFIIPFRLDEETLTAPSFFQMVFTLDNMLYRYGFEANEHVIESEWLFGKQLNSDKPVKERVFFTREGMDIAINEATFKEAKPFANHKKGNAPLFRDNALFLSVLAAWNVQTALKISAHFQHNLIVISGLSDAKLDNIALGKMSDPVFRSKVVELLKSIDPTIQDIQRLDYNQERMRNVPGGADLLDDLNKRNQQLADINIIRQRKGSNEDVRFSLPLHEAEGTKKVFAISPFLFAAIDRGATLIIDEFDAKMHPKLTRKIIELFDNPQTNPEQAQLVFITHDSNLMDAELLRRDQISFAKKDNHGATELYSLAEFKGIRNDASFEKDYLMGKYFAVPNNLNQFETAFQND